MDRNFPTDPSVVESRLLQGGSVRRNAARGEPIGGPTIQEHDARSRAMAAGILRYVRSPEVPKSPEAVDIYDVGESMDLDKFTRMFDEHYNAAQDVYIQLMSKSLAYMSAIQVLQISLSRLDQFRDMEIDTALIGRIVRAHMIHLLCKELELDPNLFLGPSVSSQTISRRSTVQPRSPSTRGNGVPENEMPANLQSLFQQIGQRVHQGLKGT